MPVPRLQGLDPASIRRLLASAQALESGRIQAAAAQLAPLTRSHPKHPEVLRVCAGILSLRGDHQRAIALMQSALAQRPDDALYYNTLGTILGAGYDLDGAVKALRHAARLQPDLSAAWYNLGVMLTHCVRHQEAIGALEQAVRLSPGHMEARALLGDMLRTGGHMQEATDQYRKIIAEQPWSGAGWRGLANIKVVRFSDEDVDRMRAALRHPHASDDDLIGVGFALAKAHDERHQYAAALAALAQANAIARRRATWSAQAFSASTSEMLDVFTQTVAPSSDAGLGREVIFIVGLPRSGSTLTEQILASHSQVQGTGELPDLPLTLTEESVRRLVPFPQWPAQADADDWHRLGKRYLQRTEHWRKQRPVFLDKLPTNWMYIGAMRAMLPAAKIIACRRDPLETCFSCYRQFLANNEYARTFEDLAAYWRDYDRSIAFWRSRAPDQLYEHSYEHLIAEPEGAIRELLAFCGLPFEEGCLRFHETDREVRSPSAMQVRQPLHDTARAPRYGELLDPLRKALGYSPFAAPAE